MRDGEALLQTTWYRWKPDYDDALLHFDRAAAMFNDARSPRQAAAAYLRASQVAEMQNASSSAGNYLEKSAKLLAGQSVLYQHQAITEFEKAGRLFAEGGNLQHGATTLHLGARLASTIDPPAALRLYTKMVDLYEISEREKLGAPALKEAIELAVKVADWTTTMNLLIKQQEIAVKYNQNTDLNRVLLTKIIISLYQTDLVAADRQYYDALKVKSFPGSPEYRVAAALLEAAEQASVDKYNVAVSNQLLSFLDPEIYKLVRTIPIRDFTPSQPSQQVEDFLARPTPAYSVGASSSSAYPPQQPATAAQPSQRSPVPSSSSSRYSRRTGYVPGEDSPPSSPESENRPLIEQPGFDPSAFQPVPPAAASPAVEAHLSESDDDDDDGAGHETAPARPVLEPKAPIFLNAGEPLPQIAAPPQPILPSNLDDLC